MIDHLVYAVTDLAAAIEDLGARLGVSPSAGGRHPGMGTRNFLLSFGQGSYLEIIGIDPDQPQPISSRPFGLDRLQEPRLVAWATRAPDIERGVQMARAAGYDPGPVLAMSRTLPDGSSLNWKLTPVAGESFPNPVPFLIDWGESPHPSTTASQGVRLVHFQVETPDPAGVQAKLAALEVSLPTVPAESPALIATMTGPAGTVTLR